MLTRVVDGQRVPLTAADEAAIRNEWVANEANPPLPPSLSPIQLRLALLKAPDTLAWASGLDLLGMVETYIASLPAATQAELALRYEYAVDVKTRDDEILKGAAQMGLGESQITDLLRLASTL